jgi:hypothetical protein
MKRQPLTHAQIDSSIRAHGNVARLQFEHCHDAPITWGVPVDRREFREPLNLALVVRFEQHGCRVLVLLVLWRLEDGCAIEMRDRLSVVISTHTSPSNNGGTLSRFKIRFFGVRFASE